MKLVDLNYYTHQTSDLTHTVDLYNESYGYIDTLKERCDIFVVKHLQRAALLQKDNIIYKGFKSRNKFFYIPFASHNYIKHLNPDVVLIQGIVFPLQTIALKLVLPKGAKIIAQHHGEQPFRNPIKNVIQKLACRYIDGFLFTAVANAQEWLKQGVINDAEKCHEVLEASTYFSKQDYTFSKKKLNLNGDLNFLWVGRLIPGKDPITVLDGFRKYIAVNKSAVLYMIYQDDTMLNDVKIFIANNALEANVKLIGEVVHNELAYWYSACDFYISGSHKEGSGYALIECMACGCIPIVTDIPPFITITDKGRLALVFKKGDAEHLFQTLLESEKTNRMAFRNQIIAHFTEKLSFEAIANDIYLVCEKVLKPV